ncbi:MAG: PHP domain-containing protein [Leptolyngbyaceae cyanobacterium]
MVVNLVEAGLSSHFSPSNVQALRQVFETVDAESCPTSFNFHMHTVCSDGRLQPEGLMEQAIALGLEGLAITDHHSVQGYQRAYRWLEEYYWDAQQRHQPSVLVPRLWTGVEVTARLLDTEVHILGYAFDLTSSAMQPYLQHHAPHYTDAAADRVIASIHAAGGLAVLAHPVRYRRSPEDLIAAAALLGIDGVETYYAYDNPIPWRTSPRQTERVQRLSSTHGLLNTCGTDTHGLSLLQRL